MKTPAFDSRQRRSGPEGFTLPELLAVAGVVLVLAALVVSGRASGPEQVKIAQCQNNLRQLCAAVQIYAGENDERLPVINGAAAWPLDLSWNLGGTLLSYGPQKKNFYCPGTAPRFTDWQNFQAPGAGQSLCNFEPGVTHVAGYVFAFSGHYSTLAISNQNTTIGPEPIRLNTLPPPYARTLPAPPDRERVLMTDATICSPANVPSSSRYSYPGISYTDVAGGFYIHHISPHLNGKFPAGGNVGFKDGHVAWRRFDDMSQVAVSGQSFWW